MGVPRLAWLLCVAALAALLGPAAARAEGFVDAYLGKAFTADQSVDLEFRNFGPIARAELRSEFDDSLSGGLRIGYWISSLPWLGVAADVSAFAPDLKLPLAPPVPIRSADITVVPISALLMLRVPLAPSDKMPGGRLQPYGAVGPGLFLTAINVDEPGFGKVTAVTADLGVDARVGVRLMLLDWLAVFGEYRFTRFHPDWDDSISGVDVAIDATLRSHHLSAGFGVHF